MFVGKIAKKADCRSVFLTIWYCILSAELNLVLYGASIILKLSSPVTVFGSRLSLTFIEHNFHFSFAFKGVKAL